MGGVMSNLLGDKIRKLRKDKGLTLDALAELSGASKSYIWELENKNPPRPSAEKLSKIAESLGTTMEFLLDTEGNVMQEDATHAHFFREYKRLDTKAQEKIRKMVEMWREDDD